MRTGQFGVSTKIRSGPFDKNLISFTAVLKKS